MTKIFSLYQVISSLANDGQADVKKAIVAKLAGVSVRHMDRLLAELKSMGLIDHFPLRDRRGFRSKTRFLIKNLTDMGSPLGKNPNGHGESVRNGLTDMGSPLGNPNGHGESYHVLKTCHAAVNDSRLKNLDFLNEPARSFCASRLTPAQSEKWREFFEFNSTHDLWAARGIVINPVGWIYRMIESGQLDAPALQEPLPGGTLEMPAFMSRGLTAIEIEASNPLGDGATFGQDGKWR